MIPVLHSEMHKRIVSLRALFKRARCCESSPLVTVCNVLTAETVLLARA